MAPNDTCRELDPWVDPIPQSPTWRTRAVAAVLSPAYEPGDGSMDGAQLVDGQWWHPVLGCDSLQHVIDNTLTK